VIYRAATFAIALPMLCGCTFSTPSGYRIEPAPQFMSFVGCSVGGALAATGIGAIPTLCVTLPAAMPETAKNVVQILPNTANRITGAQ